MALREIKVGGIAGRLICEVARWLIVEARRRGIAGANLHEPELAESWFHSIYEDEKLLWGKPGMALASYPEQVLMGGASVERVIVVSDDNPHAEARERQVVGIVMVRWTDCTPIRSTRLEKYKVTICLAYADNGNTYRDEVKIEPVVMIRPEDRAVRAALDELCEDDGDAAQPVS